MDTQDVDCAGPGVNRCVDGQCTCGATGGSCTAASGQPRCVQAANLLMLAVGADAENAVCSVSYFFTCHDYFLYNHLVHILLSIIQIMFYSVKQLRVSHWQG